MNISQTNMDINVRVPVLLSFCVTHGYGLVGKHSVQISTFK